MVGGSPAELTMGAIVTSPHISWLKHGSHAETALVGSVVVGGDA